MLCRLQRSLERGSDEILAAGLGKLELKSAVVVHSRCAAAERRAGFGPHKHCYLWQLRWDRPRLPGTCFVGAAGW